MIGTKRITAIDISNFEDTDPNDPLTHDQIEHRPITHLRTKNDNNYTPYFIKEHKIAIHREVSQFT